MCMCVSPMDVRMLESVLPQDFLNSAQISQVKKQKNPGIENYIQSSKIKGYKPTISIDMARCWLISK